MENPLRNGGMQESRKKTHHHLEPPCDICGDVGFRDLLSTCSVCEKSREHIYCMRQNLLSTPKKWVCDACLLESDMKALHFCSKGPKRVSEEVQGDNFLSAKHNGTSPIKMDAIYNRLIMSSPLVEHNADMLPKLEDFPEDPDIKATWRGSFEILDAVSHGNVYEGLQAYPSSKISRRAFELSKQMPERLQFVLRPRNDVWPEIFQTAHPTMDDIAMHFVVGQSSRCKEKYASLLDSMEVSDLAMWSFINGVELLIFTSKQLIMEPQGTSRNLFLWGVFRLQSVKGIVSSTTSSIILGSIRQENQVSPLKHDNDADSMYSNIENDVEVVDMEIDMVGGKDVGRIDKVIKRTKSEPCIQWGRGMEETCAMTSVGDSWDHPPGFPKPLYIKFKPN